MTESLTACQALLVNDNDPFMVMEGRRRSPMALLQACSDYSIHSIPL